MLGQHIRMGACLLRRRAINSWKGSSEPCGDALPNRTAQNSTIAGWPLDRQNLSASLPCVVRHRRAGDRGGIEDVRAVHILQHARPAHTPAMAATSASGIAESPPG